jgi:hypoxanthine phosphoribosyltransferase
MIGYKSIEDLSNTIRQNLWKVPNDIDLIVGVPRSGMFCAIFLSTMLNKPVISLEDFIDNRQPSGGGRMKFINTNSIKNILVLDDNVCSGRAIIEVKDKISKMKNFRDYNFTYACIYAEGGNAKELVDIYFEDNHIDNIILYLYEWNIMHFDAGWSEHFMYDIDGIICKDPIVDDRVEIDLYEQYINDPKQMIVPSRKIGAFVTYRLEKYRGITENMFKKLGIQYHQLYMVNAYSWEERANMCSPSEFKAYIYKNSPWAYLFIESNKIQAQEIAQLSGKAVWCYEDGKMYQ